MIARRHKNEPHLPRVLLADDDQISRNEIKDALHAAGASVTECHDGLELFTELSPLLPPRGTLDFDLIVVDPAMPGASWLEIVAAINTDDTVPPLVLIKGTSGRTPDVDLTGLVVAGYIEAPLENDAVLDALFRAMRRPQGSCHESRPRRGEPCS